MESAGNRRRGEVAIIAMTGRFPGADDLETFWANLRDGREGITTFSDQALVDAGIAAARFQDPRFVRAHGVLDDVELFDTELFEIPVDEAALIDPQHRVFLTESLRAIELAGYDPDTCGARISVYASVSTNTYALQQIYKHWTPETPAEQLDVMVGNDKDFVATRVAYALNLTGACYSIQTACSSSLVAVHRACQDLISGECELALAGGATVKLPQVTGYLYEPGKLHSADGKVRAFDARASGIVLGNGVGLVVLKRLDDALRDGDSILAVIKGSATNNDGARKASYESLGKAGQVRVIREALDHAGVTPADISYVEAHGTGTILGDALEVSALNEVFLAGAEAGPRCALGSVKTNIGHLDAASGIAGLIKTVLMLEHRALVPSLHYDTANPNIDFATSPFYVATQHAPWDAARGPRRAGVSSFGIGGTNAHVIVEEAPPAPGPRDARTWQILTVSAKSEDALTRRLEDLRRFHDARPDTQLADLCYTANVGRRQLAHRQVIVCGDAAELREALAHGGAADLAATVRRKNRALAWLLPDFAQASPGLGLELYCEEPDFREAVDRCVAELRASAGLDCLAALYPGWSGLPSLPAGAERVLPRTSLFVFQLALAQLWRGWGLTPEVLLGVGVGELVAACLAGVVTRAQGLMICLGADGVIDLARALAEVVTSPPSIPVICARTGAPLGAAELGDPQRWLRADDEPRALEGLAAVIEQRQLVFLELGPDAAMIDRIRGLPGGQAVDAVASYDVAVSPDARLRRVVVALGQLWLHGFKVDWSRYYVDEKRRRIALPTYPVQGRRVWFEAARRSQAAPPRARDVTARDGIDDAASEMMTLPDDPQQVATRLVQRLIAERTGLAVEAVDLGLGCFEHGLSSHDLLWATSVMKRQVSPAFLPSQFLACATLAELANHLATHYPDELSALRSGAGRSDAGLVAIPSRPTERFEPFPLSDVQQAFLAGGMLPGGVACLIYLELELPDLELDRLSHAWTRLIEHHDMLRAIVSPDGHQRILRAPPSYQIAELDLRSVTASDREARLVELRARMSQRVHAADHWPLFEVCVTRAPTTSRVHLSFDELIIDACSLQILLYQWRSLYEQPAAALPEVPISFRDYLLHAGALESSERHHHDLAYWIQALADMPSGPLLPTVDPDGGNGQRQPRIRLEGHLAAEIWQPLQRRLAERNLSATAFVLTVFVEVLRGWSKRDSLSLLMTFFNRLLHPELVHTVGPFLSTTIFVAEPAADRDLEAMTAATQRRIYDGLGHSRVSGVKVLRELKALRKLDRSHALPVVFTSLLGAPGMDRAGSFARHTTAGLTQTPQVWLDHQVSEASGELRFNWDFAPAYFEPGAIEGMFADFEDALGELARHPDGWGPWRPKLAHRARRYQPFPLTDQQQAYAFGRTRHGGGGSPQLYQELDAEALDEARLGDAWTQVMTVHEMLTAVIDDTGKQRVVASPPPYAIQVHDLRGLDDDEARRALARIQTEMVTRCCPLGEWPFFELRVSRLAGGLDRVHLSIDLLIADANSVELIYRDLAYFYHHPRAIAEKQAPSFAELQHARSRAAATEHDERDMQYWKAKLAGLPPGPQPPAARDADARTTRRLEAVFPGWDALCRRSAALGVAPGMVLLTAYAEVLAVWCGGAPFSIVIPSWERLGDGSLDEIVGDFTAMSWLAVDRDVLGFEARVRLTEQRVREDLSHRAVSGLRALRAIARNRRDAAPLAFPVVFTDLKPAPPQLLAGGFRRGAGLSRTPQVLIDNISEHDGADIRLCWDVADGVLPVGVIEDLFARYQRVLHRLADDPGAWQLTDLTTAMASPTANVAPAAAERCLHALIEDQVRRTPDAIAIQLDDHQLTYAELNARANQCARYLRAQGVGPNVLVAVMMERSLALSVALLAILKAGGAYVPLDPAYPADRLAFMREDAGVSIVLTQDSVAACADGYDESDLEPVATPRDLAYVIYTSGSTGVPKGCMISHRAICNRLLWMQAAYRVGPDDRILQKTPFTFDVSVWELFLPLLAGSRLVMARPRGHQDPRYLVEAIVDHQISICHFVPSMLRFFLQDAQVSRCQSLRHVFASGEALPFELGKELRSLLPARLHNLYGPTEAAVDVTSWEWHERPDRVVPIGCAIDNLQIFVLTPERTPVAPGAVGELYIGGIGLAEGYLNRPELTAERFVRDPFSPDPSARLYRTGDSARQLDDGNFVFLGRSDGQVKLRGFRIELGEVEAVLRQHEAVRDVVVVVQDQATVDPKLVAYVVAAGSIDRTALPSGSAAGRGHAPAVDGQALRAHARTILPAHMVPNVVVCVDAFQLSAHGKLDRSSLPWPVGAPARPPAARPSVDIAERLLAICRELAERTELAADDDLFDLGATSFTMARIVGKVERELGVAIPVEVFLSDPRVRNLSAYVEATRATSAPASRPSAPVRTQLLPVAFRHDAYAGAARADATSPGPIARRDFDGLMSLLREQQTAQGPRYRYASAGGLNPVQAYVYVAPDRVQGIPGGVYYHHPVEHRLHVVTAGELEALPAMFAPDDQAWVRRAGFVVFLVAQMKAIEPLYQANAPLLATLEAGYIGHLLVSRQAELGLALCPVTGVDFDRISARFALDAGHRFLHCLVGGARGPMFRDAPAGYRPQARGSFASFLCAATADITLPTRAEPPTKGERLQLRPGPGGDRIDLERTPVDGSVFEWRAAKRSFLERAVSFAQLSKLLALVRAEPAVGGAQLYHSVTGSHALHVYLYVKPAGVEGLAPGLYRYDPDRHDLTRVGDGLSCDFEACHTPFNRKHARSCRFAVFFVAPLGDLAPVYGEDSLYLSLLGAGYIGQLLLERQSELGLGLCPIGGLRFDKIRADFPLRPDDRLVHSFVGGGHEATAPAGWRFLEAGRAEAAVAPTPARDIAIVGMSGRFAGADDLGQYWDNLHRGARSLGEAPEHRHRLYAVDRAAKPRPYRGGFLRDIDCFDGRLFNISPREAKTIDPQERLLLEVVMACLEDSGYTSEGLKRSAPRVGVFIGAMWDDYQHYGHSEANGAPALPALSHHSSAANRVSHVFDLDGPSVAVNTSCSSALTAIHQACNALRRGECDAAIVGAANLLSHPYHYEALESLGLLSKQGTCHPFGQEADGWIVGEAVAAILLRPLTSAEPAGDHIHAVIKGTAAGHTGRSVRFGAPVTQAQRRSMAAALADAGVTADSISYVEAAAAGASLADASEMAAIVSIFQRTDDRAPAVHVGSVKPNIGHAEAASGLSQVIKVVLQLQHQQLCPTLDIGTPSALLQLAGSGIALNDALRDWQPRDATRRALINAFGATGSGAHVVVEEYARKPQADEAGREHLIVLSAATPAQLEESARRLLAALERPQPRPPGLADLAFTLQTGRPALQDRLALVVRSHAELRAGLSAYLRGDRVAGSFTGRASGESTAVANDPSLTSVAERWVGGASIAWHDQGCRVPLPASPLLDDRHWIRPVSAGPSRAPDEPAVAPAADLQRYVMTLFAEVTETPLATLDPACSFDAYGLTSLMIQELNTRLAIDHEGLSKTLFFQCRNLGEVAAHLARRVASSPVSPPRSNDLARRSPVPGEHRPRTDGIAIVGLGGRYPHAHDVAAFWDVLRDGVDCISEIPRDRWDADRQGKPSSKWGGFLDGHDAFDPMFFGITPAEAEGMSPEERLFLQTAWHTIEDAGYSRDTFKRVVGARVGVFVGVMYSEYQLYSPAARDGGDGPAVGASHGSIAHRASYTFDFTGPSMAVDTMCSASLTALHLAVSALRNDDCDAAIVGGVNLSLHPNKYLLHAQATMSASDGRCRSFGAGGDGFVPGEGVGAVLLKPLHKAIADGDQIYATIRATSINHDGRTHGYTVPNPRAQAAMITEALARAEVQAGMVSYVEAHGTGTALGDPIELTGLTEAFRATTSNVQFCAIGSAKSNIGHLEAAAGIAGLTKILLQMRHKLLVPSLHSTQLNPNIDFDHSPFYVPQRLASWERLAPSVPRIACISSFGAGGANAHAVLEEPEARATTPPPAAEVIIPLSAKDPDRLRAYAEALRAFTMRARQAPPSEAPSLRELGYTLQVGREAMPHRLCVVVRSMAELTARLEGFLAGELRADDVLTGQVARHRAGHDRHDDEDFLVMIRSWIAKGKYRALADHWVTGLELDWGLLYGDDRPRRVSAPVYPFAAERYWVPGATRAPDLREAPEPADTLLLRPVWRSLSPTGAAPAQRAVILCGAGFAAAGDLEPGVQVVELDPQHGLGARFEACALAVLGHIQAAARRTPAQALLLQVVVPAEGPEQMFSGLSGLLNTARLEHSWLTCQLVQVDPTVTTARLRALVNECAGAPAAHEVRHDAGGWMTHVLEELPRITPGSAGPWTPGGVYLITGGAGALALVFAEAIARQVRDATLILVGRSKLSAAATARLDQLRGAGASVVYREVDVGDRQAVDQLVQDIVSESGRLTGVLHCAGLLKDGLIRTKTRAEVAAVLRPKVHGAINLDEATRSLPLELFVVFSSAVGWTGNLGQADYACANAFLGAYARHRAGLVEARRRHGRSLSIRWPLWRDGGMRMDATAQARVRDALGLIPMATGAGLTAFAAAVDSAEPDVMIVAGVAATLRTALLQPRPAALAAPAPIAVGPGLRPAVVARLKSLLSEVTKIPVSKLDALEALEAYGIDSILITRLNQQLRAAFANLPQTLFFEYLTVDSVAGYLVEQHAEACLRWVGVEPQPPEPRATQPRAPQPAPRAAAPEPIAIIGMSGHYPKADGLDELWQRLRDGADCITEVPAQRWALSEFYAADRSDAIARGKSYSKWGGFLDGFAQFDPLFFQISPRDAVTIDPQERLFLQTCWEALEDAGLTRRRLEEHHGGRVGVFAGVTKTEFELFGPELARRGQHIMPRTSFSSVANRVSFTLNLSGPSLAIDTMCASSLTAIYEACEHLLRDDCELALAGAVNLNLHPSAYTVLCAHNMLSASGRCHSFGNQADGFVPGEGVGAVVLKRLSRAIADQDPIHAVIRSASVNHGGRTNGYTVPSPVAQAALVRAAIDRAGVDARAISYIEAHGTGTALGDPIEIAGLTRAFRGTTQDTGFCAVGSVKSNLGHLEAAAGMAGLAKVVLQMKHRELVPSLHAAQLNDKIDFTATPFYVQRERGAWRRPVVQVDGQDQELRRLAGISSFGAGGSNAHVLVEEWAPDAAAAPAAPDARAAIIVLSARDPDRLRAYARRLRAFIEPLEASDELGNLAYTLQVGREPMEERLGLVVTSLRELGDKLRDFLAGAPRIAGLHRGQISQRKEQAASLASAADLAQLVTAARDHGRHGELIERWVNGAAIDWRLLHGEAPPRRIHGPTYPFAQDSYWFDTLEPAAIAAPAPARQWVSLEEAWVPAAIDHDGTSWADRVAAVGERSVIVISQDAHHHQAIEQVCQAVARIAGRDAGWDVAYLPLRGSLDDEQLRALVAKPAARTVYLMLPGAPQVELALRAIQALLTVAATSRLQVYCCYQDTGGEAAVWGEALAGLVKSAMLESVDHRYRTIAYDPALVASGQLAVTLVQDWLCDDTAALQPAIVPMIRHASAARLELQIAETTARRAAPRGALFRDGATYLMVGGLGEVGRELCVELARRFAPQLVILSRRAPQAVAADLARIEAAGARVVYRSVDILDRVQLDRTMASLKAAGIELHGVVHLARSVADAPLVRKRFDEFASVMAAKAQGTVNIDAVTQGEPLELFLACSSVAAFGIRGSADYACATAFQNGFIRHRNQLVARGQRRGRSLAVCWGQWDRDGGVAPELWAARLQDMRRRGFDTIDARSAVDALQATLDGSSDVLGLIAVHDRSAALASLGFGGVAEPGEPAEPGPRSAIDHRLEAFANGELSRAQFAAFLDTLHDDELTPAIRQRVVRAIQDADRAAPPAPPALPDTAAPSSLPPEELVLGVIRRSVEKVLGVKSSQLSPHKPFQDYGLDSVTAMQMATLLERDLEARVPTSWLIEYPTLMTLATKLGEAARS